MFRGMGEKSATVAGLALLLALAPGGAAKAADLGGGCCADLEERIAELEATAARKGNRVVSLQISGMVNEAILAWDDGVESDAYIVGNTSAQSRLDFKGEATISPNLKAGFFIELGVFSEASFLVDQESDEALNKAFSDNIFIRHNALYIDHSQLGRLWIGQTSGATDSITEINVAKSVIVRSPGAQIFDGFFQTRLENGKLSGVRMFQYWGGDTTQGPGEGHRYDLVKYESPSIAGFKVSASWGEDDMWDVALRYAGLVGGRVKLAAGIGYGSFTDIGTNNGCVDVGNGVDCHQLGMSVGAMDIPTGLFAHVAYGTKTDNAVEDDALFSGDNTDDMLYIQAGIEKNWFGPGATTLFGEYETFDSGFRRTGGAIGFFDSANTEIWGIGINQSFDSAALDLYASYRNISIDSTTAGEKTNYEDFQEVLAGARISF